MKVRRCIRECDLRVSGVVLKSKMFASDKTTIFTWSLFAHWL